MAHKAEFFIDGQKAPSVTEVLSSFNQGWLRYFFKKYGTVSHELLNQMGVSSVNCIDIADQVGKEGRERGTRYHNAAEALFKGKPLDEVFSEASANEYPSVESLVKFVEQYQVKPVHIEKHVESKAHLYHGTLDLVTRIEDLSWLSLDFFNNPVPEPEGKLFITDHKTVQGRVPKESEIKKHAMQQVAYAKALEEQEGLKLTHGLVLYADMETSLITPVPIYPLEQFWEPFLCQRKLYDLIESLGPHKNLRKRKKA